MKILGIHADFIEFTAKKRAFKAAEEDVSQEKTRVEECLVIFTAVEKSDEDNVSSVLKRYLEEVKKIAEQVKATNVVLYPYAHLSSNLSSPKIAEQFLKDAQVALEKEFSVSRAPFGWYKSFTIACKGHPLSELSREFGAEEKSLKREAKDEKFTFDEKELTKQEQIKLSAAVVVGKVVQQLHPKAQLGSFSFYQDQAYIDVTNVKLHQNDLAKIEDKAKELLKESMVFAKLTHAEELPALQQQIANDLKDKAVTYQVDDLTLTAQFREPFIYSSDEIQALKLLNLSSAYWKNNENNEQLQRIYLVAFANEQQLQDYEKRQLEAQERSHLKIGKEQNLFLVSDLVGAGLPLLAPKGKIIRDEIISFLWDLHKDKGYSRVWTPHIAKEELYKTSGHWDKFGDELLKVQGKSDKFVMKPMNCPHHMQIFNNTAWSYRDMPVRFFEAATIYRDEKSGQLHGLSRVRAITQDDCHIFCRISQIKEEVGTIAKIANEFFKTLGMEDYWVSFSVRGADKVKYLGSDEVWQKAETALEDAAKEYNLPFKRIEGEAAFYGPKLDFMFKDVLGREWQLTTIQCDFNLPERFKLHYMNEEGKKEQPVVVHRVIAGSIERFMSILIEHFAGKFPLWLSPVQVKIVTINDSHKEFANKIAKQMQEQDLRVEVDERTESMGKKVREAQLQKVNYIITVGDKEVEKQVLSVRTRAGEVTFDINVDGFIEKLVTEVKEKKL